MKFGERLKTAREAAALTQDQLAEKIANVFGKEHAPSQKMISKMERDKSAERNKSQFVVRIAAICAVSPLWLDSEIGPQTPDKGRLVVVDVPAVNVRTLEEVIAKVMEAARRHKRNLDPRQVATSAAAIYGATKPDGSLDWSSFMSLIETDLKGGKREGRNKGNTDKSSRRGV